jgi:hypothetical protein
MSSNALLSGKAHQIDGMLHQYWVTITPSGNSDDVAALSASAYIVLPADVTRPPVEGPPAIKPVSTAVRPKPPAPPVSIPNAGKDAMIGPLAIVSPPALADCGFSACSMLETRARVDAIVFFLEHQANHGLVRLADAECRDRTSARIARSGESVQFPIARTSTRKRDWTETYEWDLAPDLDTYYAVVVTDAKLARRIANHMDKLPMRCSEALRPGLEDEQLQAWLNDLAMLTARATKNVDWRAIEVKNVL